MGFGGLVLWRNHSTMDIHKENVPENLLRNVSGPIKPGTEIWGGTPRSTGSVRSRKTGLAPRPALGVLNGNKLRANVAPTPKSTKAKKKESFSRTDPVERRFGAAMDDMDLVNIQNDLDVDKFVSGIVNLAPGLRSVNTTNKLMKEADAYIANPEEESLEAMGIHLADLQDRDGLEFGLPGIDNMGDLDLDFEVGDIDLGM